MKKYIAVVTTLVLMAILIGGCANVPSGEASIPAGMGRIEVRVTDAPPENIAEIWVTVVDSEEEDGVVVHKAGTDEDGDGGWIPIDISEGKNPFELLALGEGGIDALLGWSDVEPGKYTQIKMTIEKVEILFEGETEFVEAELPSGKLKFVRPFDVVDGETTIIKLDFIAEKSMTVTGQGKVIFKPVVKLLVSSKEKPIELEYSLGTTTDDATAELSAEEVYSGEESVHLDTGTEGTGVEARIVIPLPGGTTLGDIESISWREYLVQGYPPHVDVMLDFDDDDLADDSLVFEYAYNSEDHYNLEPPMPYGAMTGAWYQTFSDDGSGPLQISDSANGWLSSGPPGPPGDPGFIYYTLALWKAGVDVDGDTLIDIDSATEVIALEIEVDNWVVQSEAYVDDIVIVIGGDTYTIDI
jgi:hypothetical protein